MEYYIDGVLYEFEAPDKLVAAPTRKPCPKCDSQASFDSRWCGFFCLGQCRWTERVAKYTRSGPQEANAMALVVFKQEIQELVKTIEAMPNQHIVDFAGCMAIKVKLQTALDKTQPFDPKEDDAKGIH